VVYDRTIEGRTLELGAVGLEKGVFLLYDRQTGSWWNQIAGRAVKGPLEGRRLRKRPSTLTTWGRWRALHPETTVFSDPRVTGRRRFTEESVSRVTLSGGGAIAGDDLIVAVEGESSARAYLLRRLAPGQVANDTIDGEPILVFLAEDAVTPRVFRRLAGERTLTFEAAGDHLRDEETGTRWDPMTGRALEGPLEGLQLEPVVFTQALWYAWRSVRPDTALWDGETAGP
jgi:hypothetical protein